MPSIYTAILELSGHLEQGFRLRLTLGQTIVDPAVLIGGVEGELPASSALLQSLQAWQAAYQSVSRGYPINRLGSHSTVPTQLSQASIETLKATCHQAAEVLQQQFNDWIEKGWVVSGGQRMALSTLLLQNLFQDQNGEVRILVKTHCEQVRYLPWHCWSTLKTSQIKPEVAICPVDWSIIKPRSHPKPKRKIRILAIFGDDRGNGKMSDRIQIQVDEAFLKQLPKATTELICRFNPSPQEFCDLLQDKKGWDLFFFAGHSATQPDGSGVFYIQHPHEQDKRLELSFDRFKQSMQTAIEQGLQLVILNSCQGLGVIRPLEELHIPQAIVMRESIPDEVAQAFLQRFLLEYSLHGKSLYQAVSIARKGLEGWEIEYPNATWLPIICQNPLVTSPTWKDLCGQSSPPLKKVSRVAIASLLVTSLVMGVRHLGFLQSSELWAFDQFMQRRPHTEQSDPRLFIVTVNQEDIEFQTQQGMKPLKDRSLSDRALERLLQKLERYQPAAIGLDIYREDPTPLLKLKQRLQTTSNLYGVCDWNSQYSNLRASPHDIPPERVGFANFPIDADNVIRRQTLGRETPKDGWCKADYSLALQLILKYLSIDYLVEQPSIDTLKLVSVTLKKLTGQSGSYQKPGDDNDFLNFNGFQILLNYRASSSIAKQRSLREVLASLTDSELTNLVHNKIVLIGAIENEDKHLTPISDKGVAGVIIHAHMVSQLLSAISDGRPLLSYLPMWGDWVWVWGWATVSCLTIFYLQISLSRRIGSSLLLVSATGICYIFLIYQALWLPVIPTVSVILLVHGSDLAWSIYSQLKMKLFLSKGVN